MLKAKRISAGIYRVYDGPQWVATLIEHRRGRWFIEVVSQTQHNPCGFGFIRQTKYAAMTAFTEFWFGTEREAVQ